MLVLTRKCQEVIVIGGSDDVDPTVKITVLEVGNGKVRLGIEAAENVPVHRLEVWERIRACTKSVPVPEATPVRVPPNTHDQWP